MAMVEYVGVLSIKLIGGTDLVAMDLNGKSDPFVVFKLGEQKAKSTVSPVLALCLSLSLVF